MQLRQQRVCTERTQCRPRWSQHAAKALFEIANATWGDAELCAKLAAMDDALAAIQKDFAARVDRDVYRDVSLPDDDHDVDDGHVPPSTDTTHANEPFDEPFGGGDAEARLASVDARLKTFAARWES